MNILTLLSKMIVLFAFIGLGLFCQKLKFLDEATCGKLNKLVIYIFAPSLIIKSVFGSKLAYSLPQLLLLIGYGFGYNLVALLLALALVRVLRMKKADRSTATFLLMFSNAAFMGFPIIAALFGNSAVLLASVSSIPYNFVIYSVGVMLLSGKSDMRQMTRKVLQNPSIYATLLSLCIFYFDVSVPQPVQDIFNYLGDMVVPCSMMLIGASLGRVSVRDIFGDMRVYLVSLARLILMPLIVALLTRLFIREPMFRNLITITSVMPSASLSPILSAEYGGNTLLASKSVFMTTLFSLLTVPILLSFLLVGV